MNAFQHSGTEWLASRLAVGILAAVVLSWLWRMVFPKRQTTAKGFPDMCPDGMSLAWYFFVWLVGLFLLSLCMPLLSQWTASQGGWILDLRTLVPMFLIQVVLLSVVGFAYVNSGSGLLPFSTSGWSGCFLDAAGHLLRGLPLVLLSGWLSGVLLGLFGWQEALQEVLSSVSTLSHPLSWVLAGFASLVLAPVAEELFFRGMLFRFLKGRCGIHLACLLSAAIFSLLHFHVESFCPLFALGYLFAWAYWWSGDIRVPVFMHAIFNSHAFFLLAADRWAF
jgi:membrane protease YdiL (CAAX protease family)